MRNIRVASPHAGQVTGRRTVKAVLPSARRLPWWIPSRNKPSRHHPLGTWHIALVSGQGPHSEDRNETLSQRASAERGGDVRTQVGGNREQHHPAPLPRIVRKPSPSPAPTPRLAGHYIRPKARSHSSDLSASTQPPGHSGRNPSGACSRAGHGGS